MEQQQQQQLQQQQQRQQQQHHHHHQHHHQHHHHFHHHHQQQYHQQERQEKCAYSSSRVADLLAGSRSVSLPVPHFSPPPPPVNSLKRAYGLLHLPDASSLFPSPLVMVSPPFEKTLCDGSLAAGREGGRDGGGGEGGGRGGGKDVSPFITTPAQLLDPKEGKGRGSPRREAQDHSVQSLPSLGSPYPGPAPYFDESMLQDVSG